MNHKPFRPVSGIVLPLVILASFSTTTLAGIEVIVTTGDNSPDGNGQLSVFVAPSLNDSSQIAFGSLLTGTIGGATDNVAFYRRDPSGLVKIVRSGEIFNGAPVTGFFPTAVSLDSSGTLAGVLITGPPTGFFNYYGSGGALTPLILPGVASPSGNNSLLISSAAATNDMGTTIYNATYIGTNAEIGLYERSKNGTVTTRLLVGDAAPRGGLFDSVGSRPTLNESDQIATIAGVDDGGSLFSMIRIDGTTVHELAREGDLADDGVTTLGEAVVFSPSAFVNESGQVAFTSKYSQPGVSREGVFLADDDGFSLIAPGLLPGGTSATASTRLFGLSTNGTVAFSTEFFKVFDPTTGLYVADANGPTLVALEDTAIPSGEKFFRTFFTGTSTLNDMGQLSFMAELSDTADGNRSGRGIYFYDEVSGLEEIVRTDDSLAGSTISDLFFIGTPLTNSLQSADNSLSGMNNLGQVAFGFVLENGDSGIALWTPESLAGDYNGDGDVDGADFLSWQRGESPDPLSATDLATWEQTFGQTESLAASQVVPEPCSFVLMLSALLGLAAVARRP